MMRRNAAAAQQEDTNSNSGVGEGSEIAQASNAPGDGSPSPQGIEYFSYLEAEVTGYLHNNYTDKMNNPNLASGCETTDTASETEMEVCPAMHQGATGGDDNLDKTMDVKKKKKEAEQRRRNRIKEALGELRKTVPQVKEKNTAKDLEIIVAAAINNRETKQTIKRLRKEKADLEDRLLKTENRLLKMKNRLSSKKE